MAFPDYTGLRNVFMVLDDVLDPEKHYNRDVRRGSQINPNCLKLNYIYRKIGSQIFFYTFIKINVASFRWE